MRDDLDMSVSDLLEHYYQQATIPATAFDKPLTPLETVCAYLHEHEGHATAQIAEETGRPYNSVRTALANAKEKAPAPARDDETAYRIPAGALKQQLSPAEAVVHHLADAYGLTGTQIARLIGRDQRNVSATLARARKKLAGDAT